MRLALLVVYFSEGDDADLFDTQQAFIQRHTAGTDYRIYAAANRLPEHLRRRVAGYPNLSLCDIPATPARENHEHAYYLDALAAVAVADGASHACTLDPDSFPIRPGWAQHLQRRLDGGMAFAGVLREENGDTALPHPSCLFFAADFYERYRPRFYPGRNSFPVAVARQFDQFVRETRQCPDTGIGFAFAAYQHRLAWEMLRRSNRADDHYLMAGIYGDLVFHLGGSSRPDRLFRGDDLRHSDLWLKALLRRAGRYLPGSGADRFVEAALAYPQARASARNERSYQEIRGRLLADPERYIAYLRTGAG